MRVRKKIHGAILTTANQNHLVYVLKIEVLDAGCRNFHRSNLKARDDMKFRRQTLRANIPLESRKPNKPAGAKTGDLPLLSQAEALVKGLISLTQFVVCSAVFGFLLLFRKKPLEVITDLTERQRMLSALLLVTTGAGIFAVFEPLTRGKVFNASDWINTVMAGSQSPNFFARFGCAMAIGLLVSHSYAGIFGFGRPPKERTALQSLGAMIYMLALVFYILVTQGIVFGRIASYSSFKFVAFNLMSALAPLALLSLGAGMTNVRVALSTWAQSKARGKRAHWMMGAIMLGAIGVGSPTAAIVGVALTTHAVEELADEAKNRSVPTEDGPINFELRPVGANCANDRFEDRVMNCIFVADMKRPEPFSFDIGASYMIYAPTDDEAFAAETFESLQDDGHPIIDHKDSSFEIKDPLSGKSGFYEAGDAVKSQHVVTLQAGKRLILRLRLQAPQDCPQFERSNELGDVYIAVKALDQGPSMPKYQFLGPWHFDDREVLHSYCGESYTRRSLK